MHYWNVARCSNQISAGARNIVASVRRVEPGDLSGFESLHSLANCITCRNGISSHRLEHVMDYETLKKELAEIAQIVQQYPEQMQAEVFAMLTERLIGETRSRPAPAPISRITPLDTKAITKSDKEEVPPANEGVRSRRSPAKRTSSKESYKIDRNLNLRGDKSIPSFRAFVSEKKPASAKEFNAVAVYYLKKLAGIELVTIDHVFTCYDEVKKRPPEHFKQSLIDTKNKDGWVEFDDNNNLNIPHRGVVFVEHDLPRQPSDKGTNKQ
jgi:hypothetical protein